MPFMAIWAAIKGSAVVRWAIVIVIALLIGAIIVWRIFAAGQRAGSAEYQAKVDATVARLQDRMRRARKPKGEDDATSDMDAGRF